MLLLDILANLLPLCLVQGHIDSQSMEYIIRYRPTFRLRSLRHFQQLPLNPLIAESM